MRRAALLVALIVLASPGTLVASPLLSGVSAPASAAAVPDPAAADRPAARGASPPTPDAVPPRGAGETDRSPAAPSTPERAVHVSRAARPSDPSGASDPSDPSGASGASDPSDSGSLAGTTGLPHADPVAVVGATAVHHANVTGRNVTVGVIDAGFRASYPAVAGKVGAYREFGAPGGWRHGTAVAGVVTDVAPNASLLLAAVGPQVSPEEYSAAVEWLLSSGADVVVDAGSYHTQPRDGSGPIDRSAARAAERAVFVTSVGNYADGYWQGTHGDGEWVTFGGNAVQGNPLGGSAGPIRATLRWTSPAADYGLFLFRERPGRDALVASARGDGDPHATLAVAVPSGSYYLAVRVRTGRNATTNATASRLELITNRDLRYRSRARPSPPATAPGVLAVGAVRHGEVREFSVPGADVVAPDRPALDVDVPGGTSIAAPYVAGAAALTVAANPTLDSAAVRERLLAGARDLGPEGVDDRTGYGLVDAGVAIHPPATAPPRIWPVDVDGLAAPGYTETQGTSGPLAPRAIAPAPPSGGGTGESGPPERESGGGTRR